MMLSPPRSHSPSLWGPEESTCVISLDSIFASLAPVLPFQLSDASRPFPARSQQSWYRVSFCNMDPTLSLSCPKPFSGDSRGTASLPPCSPAAPTLSGLPTPLVLLPLRASAVLTPAPALQTAELCIHPSEPSVGFLPLRWHRDSAPLGLPFLTTASIPGTEGGGPAQRTLGKY